MHWWRYVWTQDPVYNSHQTQSVPCWIAMIIVVLIEKLPRELWFIILHTMSTCATTHSTQILRDINKPSGQFLLFRKICHKSSQLSFHFPYFLNKSGEHFKLQRCHRLLGITTRLRIELAFETKAFSITICQRVKFAFELRAFLTELTLFYTWAYDRSDGYN